MKIKLKKLNWIAFASLLAMTSGGAFVGSEITWGFLPIGASHRANKPGLYWSGNKAVKKVALTFDDGPSAPYTQEILDTLKEYNVKATFFMIGKHVEEHPELAREVAAQGNVIGNHTYSHFNSPFIKEQVFLHDILRGGSIIEKTTGVRPVLFRPPHGWISSRILNYARRHGYSIVEWTISPRDWSRPPEQTIVKRVISQVRNGSIILLHDGDGDHDRDDRLQTVEALPQLINELRARGYQLVTVPELVNLDSDNADQKALAQLPTNADPQP